MQKKLELNISQFKASVMNTFIVVTVAAISRYFLTLTQVQTRSPKPKHKTCTVFEYFEGFGSLSHNDFFLFLVAKFTFNFKDMDWYKSKS